MIKIGGFFRKGRGARLARRFRGDARVVAMYVEAGRSADLFLFREFGSAAEVDIVTLLVRAEAADAVFAEVYELAGLDRSQTGVMYQAALPQRFAFARGLV